eukprot:10521725-Alexandrium_andersonii.AAC.1
MDAWSLASLAVPGGAVAKDWATASRRSNHLGAAAAHKAACVGRAGARPPSPLGAGSAGAAAG